MFLQGVGNVATPDNSFALMFLQDVGNVATLPHALPDGMSYVVGSQQEEHRRLVICWDRTSFPTAKAIPIVDTPFFFVGNGLCFAEETIAFVNVHLLAAASPT